MTTLQFDIEDQLIQNIGITKIREFIDRQLVLLRLAYLGEKIGHEICISGMDHSLELDNAREEAWQEYKSEYRQLFP